MPGPSDVATFASAETLAGVRYRPDERLVPDPRSGPPDGGAGRAARNRRANCAQLSSRWV
jgi:hypothetical protein